MRGAGAPAAREPCAFAEGGEPAGTSTNSIATGDGGSTVTVALAGVCEWGPGGTVSAWPAAWGTLTRAAHTNTMAAAVIPTTPRATFLRKPTAIAAPVSAVVEEGGGGFDREASAVIVSAAARSAVGEDARMRNLAATPDLRWSLGSTMSVSALGGALADAAPDNPPEGEGLDARIETAAEGGRTDTAGRDVVP
jgi:hypothetical protein